MALEDDPCWPSFLSRLDSDPELAMEEFYNFVWEQVRTSPPKTLRFVSVGERQDAVCDFIFHCISRDFYKLRMYANEGKRFAGWLNSVATYYFIDWIRREENPNYTFEEFLQEDEKVNSSSGADQGVGADINQEWLDLCELVKGLLLTIGEKCRLLLTFASEEYEIKEIVTALRLPKNENKAVSENLRECRRKLRKLIEQQGVTLSEYFGN